MKPIIAVTTTSYTGAEYRTPQIMLGSPYLAAVQSVGGTPLLITPAHGEKERQQLLELCDGLMLSGGEDVDPSLYGQQPHRKLGTVNRDRDEMEIAVFQLARERGIPILAVCRGFQLMNVALGGTLFQDLPSQRHHGIIHEQDAPITDRWHGATVQPGSCLASIFGVTELDINSFHHQGIDRLADELTPTVWAEDDLIEGAEMKDRSWVLGVQWHPERGEAEIPGDRRHPDKRLFWAFVQAARAFREERLAVGAA